MTPIKFAPVFGNSTPLPLKGRAHLQPAISRKTGAKTSRKSRRPAGGLCNDEKLGNATPACGRRAGAALRRCGVFAKPLQRAHGEISPHRFFQGEQFMTDKTISLDLYKANAALQLRLTRLLQESGHHWLQSMQQTSAEGLAETSAKIEGLLQSASWQTLATLPTESFWRLLRASDAKTPCKTRPPSPREFSRRCKRGRKKSPASWRRRLTHRAQACPSHGPPGCPALRPTPKTVMKSKAPKAARRAAGSCGRARIHKAAPPAGLHQKEERIQRVKNAAPRSFH